MGLRLSGTRGRLGPHRSLLMNGTVIGAVKADG